MAALDLAIRNGTVITATETLRADVGVAEGIIVEIGTVGDARVEEDASGLYALPGVVDPHTHLDAQFRPDGPHTADDFLSGTIAAACGGVTTRAIAGTESMPRPPPNPPFEIAATSTAGTASA